MPAGMFCHVFSYHLSKCEQDTEQRRIEDAIKHLGWRFFAKIVS